MTNATLAEASNQPLQTYQLTGRILGPAIFLVMMLAAEGQAVMPDAAWRAAAGSTLPT